MFNTAEDISDIIPDPLFEKQWFLNHGAVDGSDMNVIPAWQKGYTGKNVVVTILDDGIQINHPDLAQNYDPMASTGHFLSDNLTLNCILNSVDALSIQLNKDFGTFTSYIFWVFFFQII